MTVKAPAFPISCALFHVWDPDNITPLPDLSTNQCEFVELCFSGPIPELVAFETVIDTGPLVPWFAEGSGASRLACGRRWKAWSYPAKSNKVPKPALPLRWPRPPGTAQTKQRCPDRLPSPPT